MKIQRQDLLKRLLATLPGVSKSKSGITQSDCVVLRKGRLYTLSREVACMILSGLDESFYGAIKAELLMDLLKKLTEEEIEVKIDEGKFHVKGKGRSFKITMQTEVLLPTDMVEIPKEWVPLAPEFAKAADLTFRCTGKKGSFSNLCIHIHPNWLEASDNNKMGRWTLDTFVKDSILVRGTTLRTMIPLGMTKACETENWIHFRNPLGLRVSLCKHSLEEYPSLDEFLNIRGKKVVFPKGLAEAAERAGLFRDEDTHGVRVTISKDSLTVECEGIKGECIDQGLRHKYNGPEMSFLIPPKLVAELVEQSTECEVSDVCLRVNGGSYTYLTSLEIQS